MEASDGYSAGISECPATYFAPMSTTHFATDAFDCGGFWWNWNHSAMAVPSLGRGYFYTGEPKPKGIIERAELSKGGNIYSRCMQYDHNDERGKHWTHHLQNLREGEPNRMFCRHETFEEMKECFINHARESGLL